MNRTLDNEKECLLNKFNELMSQKKKRSKEEILNQLFNEDIYNSTRYKGIGKNKSTTDVFKTTHNGRNKKLDELGEKEEEYNDFEKQDTFFVTNLKKEV